MVIINRLYKKASSTNQASGTGEAIDGISNTLVKQQMIAKGLGKAGNDLNVLQNEADFSNPRS